MKSKFLKSIVSITLVLIMVFSTFSVSFVPVGAAEVEKAETSFFGTFFANQALSTGLCAVGSVLISVADATDVEELEALSSFLGVWVFGTNPNSGSLERIEQMCADILDEVEEINEKMDVYNALLLSQVEGTKLTLLESERTTAWTNDVENVLKSNNLSKGFNAFFNYQTLMENSTVDKKNAGYLVATTKYMNNEDGFTEDDVKNSRQNLFDAFCEIHGSIPDFVEVEDDKYIQLTTADKAKKLFEEPCTNGNSMDVLFRDTIKELSDNLTKVNDNSYIDKCAQVANVAYVDMADQRDFIFANMNKQMLVITLTELMYEEYLAMRGEYLEATYEDESHAQWQMYYNDVYGNVESDTNCLKSLNEYVGNEIQSRISTPMLYDVATGGERTIGEYPRQSDLAGVKLKNTTYYSSFTDYESEKAIVDEYMQDNVRYHVSNADFTKMFMEFDKLMVSTPSGPKMYYLLFDEAGDKNSKETKLVYCDFGPANDFFVPSCDYINLTRGVYSDGSNSFASVALPKNESELFSTDNYYLKGSTPSVYFSKYCSEYSGKPLYQVFPTYTYHYKNAFYDGYPELVALDMTQSIPSLDIASNEPIKLDGQDIHEGYSGWDSGYYYSVILSNQSTQLNNTLSYNVTGEYTADVIITDKNGNSIDLNNPIECGKELVVKIKPENDTTAISYMSLCKYNNEEDTSAVTGEDVILSEDDYKALQCDPNGYYMITINMPYSDTVINIETDIAINQNEEGKFIIRNYNDLVDMATKVNSGAEEYVNGDYILAGDITVPEGETWTNPIGQYPNYFKGTFDGQGCTISGLNYEGSLNQEHFALFGLLGEATIKNVNLADVNFNINKGASDTAEDIAGLCAALSYGSEISNCTVSGNITVTSESGYQPTNVGGVCAVSETNYSIEKCINYCNIDADAQNVGGICGYAYYLTQIKNCANMGDIKAYQLYPTAIIKRPENCAGIVGQTQGTATAISCYNVGTISGDSNNSSIVSLGVGDFPSNCYYLDTCAQDSYATAKTLEQFNSGEVTYLLNNGVTDSTQVWYQNVDYKEPYDEYPHFNKTEFNTVYIDGPAYTNTVPIELETDENGNFVIKTYDELVYAAEKVNSGLEEYVNGNFVLANDITCDEEWTTPIGTQEFPFTGNFDGQNHSIIGLKATKTAGRFMGLFGVIEGSTVKNIHLTDVDFDIVTDSYSPVSDAPDAMVGALCGEAYLSSTILNCTTSGRVKVKGALDVGGMCGYVATGTSISKCINNCDVQSDSEYIGGLVGNTNRNVKISSCANKGSVTTDGAKFCGGISGAGFSEDSINNCYNTGKIGGKMTPIGTHENIGAISGDTYTVNNCYYLDTSYTSDPMATAKTIEQFKSGEVTFLLNKTLSISGWAWFQNIDNGKTPDEFPTLTFTRDNVVFKVDREDKVYSNVPDKYLLGDADLDGYVTIVDVTTIQLHCAKLYELQGAALVNADTIKDNVISITDATKVQMFIAGLIDEL